MQLTKCPVHAVLYARAPLLKESVAAAAGDAVNAGGGNRSGVESAATLQRKLIPGL